ncbi:MAG: class I SAM-dependent methyltransferase [Anaerolineales bacterium]|nr:class I SAM-dependent methyltransferase [Anaerolineales bacterium]MCW5854643.1 class I SAM-dependent methyltransferase [Anaerolineales bacterium]
MAEHNAFYQKVNYYDIVFDRDVRKEVDFLLGVYHKYAGHAAQSTLDVACGPAYHAREVARRGLRSVGIDLRPEMVEYARQRAEADGLQLELRSADMRRFRLKQPVDLAFIVFDGIDALVENRDLVSHFQAMAANLTSRGVYIIDVSHPRHTSLTHYGKFHYHGQRGGTSVDIRWATNKPHVDLLTGIADTEIEIRVKEKGKQPAVIKDKARERILSAQEITLLAQLSKRLSVVGWYGDYNLKQPLDDTDASQRMIAVLQRND